jgi:hypothetical protein
VFPDVDQCKSAVTHHAILHDHAFQIVEKDKVRFRAICKKADQGCNWKFFIYKQEIPWLHDKFNIFMSIAVSKYIFIPFFSKLLTRTVLL